MQKYLEKLLQLRFVEAVNSTRANGQIKHYNIRIRTAEKRLISVFETLWPFGNISLTSDGLTADYIVKPAEIETFYVKIEAVKNLHNLDEDKAAEEEVAVIIRFKQPVTRDIKEKLPRSVRGRDRIVWSDTKLVIFLRGTQKENAVQAVQKRIRDMLPDYNFDISIQAR